jgi:hypothetical protein
MLDYSSNSQRVGGTDSLGRNVYELWEFVMQPFSILEEIVLVVLVKFIPIFGRLGIIFHCIQSLVSPWSRINVEMANLYPSQIRVSSVVSPKRIR